MKNNKLLLILIFLVIVFIVLVSISSNSPLRIVANMVKKPDLKCYWYGTIDFPGSGHVNMILVINDQEENYFVGDLLTSISTSPKIISGHIEKIWFYLTILMVLETFMEC